MLTIQGTPRTLCDGLTRRDLLQVGALGPLGIGLGDVLAAETGASGTVGLGAAKSCILLFPYGSPPTHETFDPKPDAPAEIRGELGSIESKLPGLRVCELLPRVAGVMDKVTVARSLTHQYPLHGVAYAVTGIPTYTPALETKARDPKHWPYVGSVVEYLDETQGRIPTRGLPGNIGLPWLMNSQTDNPLVNAGVFSGFLSNRYDPVWTDFDGPGLNVAPKSTVAQTKRFRNPYGGTTPGGRFRMAPSARLSRDLSIERLGLRRSLLEQFERQRRDLDASLRVQAMSRQREVAMSLLTSSRVLDALDIGRESPEVRERYGMTLFGQTCLAARRLIESGARFVTVLWDCFGQFANGAWDTHQYHYPRLKELLLPGFDLAYSALIEDMSSRGLLDETLVMWMSEHGRTPKLNSKPGGGRDHWSRAYTAVVAGGGTAAGRVVGRTTPDGGDVRDTPISPKDMQATLFHLLGHDPQLTMPDRNGQPHLIAGTGSLRPELLC
ncbi:MAG TPA: DUF1501 domain-containing protein [Planctomycetaceae bacterium]|jgi:hypothetical protein|nr:hypothetical protein [Planctomycetaceae bacterium]HAA52750.1 DUF1501 domain-containing protein [Planctomycetaceae bacterium]HCK55236.1 DUF1501 domain-containing protein [Planctomycetaceae bacterium]|tara:strand:+ start:1652 stop:3142 length:1491 start_codon:yes stop_codon:yes gene_type:complete